jgi:hypothetical protein
MRPLVPEEARDKPQHAQGLDGPRGDNTAAVEWLPAELSQHLADWPLYLRAIAANKHRGRTLLVARVAMRGAPTLLQALTMLALGARA